MNEPMKVQDLEDVGHSNEVTVDEVKPDEPVYEHPCSVHIELRDPIHRGSERVNYHMIYLDDPSHVTVETNGTLIVIFDDNDGNMMTKRIPAGQWLESNVRRLRAIEVMPDE